MARRWRRTTWTAVVVAGALGVTAGTTSGASGQEGELPPGYGSAIAYGTRVNPTAAELSLAISVGISLAGHQNTVSSAESRGIDLGIIGTTLAAEACDGGDPTLPADEQPRPLRTASTDDGADAGFTEQEDVPPGAPITKYVRAEGTPFSESITTAAPFGVPGVLEVSGVRTMTTSGIVDGLREARAISEVGALSLAAGAVQLGNMRWEAVHRSGGEADELTGTFTIGSASVAGTPIPTNDPNETLNQLNTVLTTLGFRIQPPRIHAEQGQAGQIQFVDPLAIQVIPNDARDALTGGLLGGGQPARESLFDALLQADCSNATFITVADIVIGSITGAGSFGLELGGVQAETRAINFSSSLGGERPTLGGANPESTGTLGAGGTNSPGRPTAGGSTPARPATGTAAPAAPSAPTGETGGTTAEIDPIAEVSGERGGALAAVGGVGMLLLAASAEGDRRKMRRAQREIPLDL